MYGMFFFSSKNRFIFKTETTNYIYQNSWTLNKVTRNLMQRIWIKKVKIVISFLKLFFNIPVKQALTQSFTFHDPHDLVIWFPKTQHDGCLGYKIWGVWFYKLQYLKGLLVICSGVSNQPIVQHVQKIFNREKKYMYLSKDQSNLKFYTNICTSI